ncbi:nuclear transport factor 2 family protein [Flavobacterium wongokense]|uniref:nuclear transport factor 2 family protein n=1 Tax=Flavobacterium wongokense TaxID=2910674 RepID=UPI001F460C23|nr:nuclear transport factor 2 family protein [Flavobacterium sp. WG47]MCF6132903.1 nuclear transport factor 2 family protein [Flavobacterium sp. WG47]
MKPQNPTVIKAILVTAFMLYNVQGMKAQNNSTMKNQDSDKAALTKVLEDNYFKGIYEGNVALLGSAFHHDTLLFGDIKGTPYAKTLEQYLDGVKNRQSPKDSGRPFRGEVLSLHIVNSIAVAEAKVTMYDFIYHDILSFHKINGNWVIVNKMLTDTNQ